MKQIKFFKEEGNKGYIIREKLESVINDFSKSHNVIDVTFQFILMPNNSDPCFLYIAMVTYDDEIYHQISI